MRLPRHTEHMRVHSLNRPLSTTSPAFAHSRPDMLKVSHGCDQVESQACYLQGELCGRPPLRRQTACEETGTTGTHSRFRHFFPVSQSIAPEPSQAKQGDHKQKLTVQTLFSREPVVRRRAKLSLAERKRPSKKNLQPCDCIPREVVLQPCTRVVD